MKQVELYIKHSTMRVKAEKAEYSYELVFRKSDGSVVTRCGQGQADNTTRNSIVLDALVEALGRLRQPVELTIHTSNDYINNMLNRKMYEEWAKNDFINKKGQKVVDWQKWKKLNEALKEHDVTASRG